MKPAVVDGPRASPSSITPQTLIPKRRETLLNQKKKPRVEHGYIIALPPSVIRYKFGHSTFCHVMVRALCPRLGDLLLNLGRFLPIFYYFPSFGRPFEMGQKGYKLVGALRNHRRTAYLNSERPLELANPALSVQMGKLRTVLGRTQQVSGEATPGTCQGPSLCILLSQ